MPSDVSREQRIALVVFDVDSSAAASILDEAHYRLVPKVDEADLDTYRGYALGT
jgi:hypothetical protein